MRCAEINLAGVPPSRRQRSKGLEIIMAASTAAWPMRATIAISAISDLLTSAADAREMAEAAGARPRPECCRCAYAAAS